MSAGQLVFYAGAALMVLTVILAVVFLVRKPRYTPENEAIAAPASAGSRQTTQRLRGTYSANARTRRRDAGAGAVPGGEDTGTILLPESGDETATLPLEERRS